jgi:exodeoxyribonuclease VII large subunit
VRAVADALSARFNPVRVGGEISGFSRAASGHCYFSLKDADGQVRCALFRRAAVALDFSPREGDQVEVEGRLDVYGPRGDLQLVVETMRRAGQGNLFEQFLQLKARLQAQGLFEPGRKKPPPPLPRAIGVVTSLGAAALRDVATALARRVPHVPVVLFPAAVQGQQAPAELMAALDRAYAEHARTGLPDVLLLVRGGGALEDLWAFNSEALAHVLARAPMPVVCGVGHETDFTIADFVADLRAPTPTAAAELCATDRNTLLAQLDSLAHKLDDGVSRHLDLQAQRLDRLAQQLTRPSDRVARQREHLHTLRHRLALNAYKKLQQETHAIQAMEAIFPAIFQREAERQSRRLQRTADRLDALDPRLVLQRGYAWLTGEDGRAITSASQATSGQNLRATLSDGGVDLQVL